MVTLSKRREKNYDDSTQRLNEDEEEKVAIQGKSPSTSAQSNQSLKKEFYSPSN